MFRSLRCDVASPFMLPQVAGQAPGGASRDEVGGPLGVHSEQRAHLQPAGDDGVEFKSATA